jgi:hypothetical protein
MVIDGHELKSDGALSLEDTSALTRELAAIENAFSIGLVDAAERSLLRAHASTKQRQLSMNVESSHHACMLLLAGLAVLIISAVFRSQVADWPASGK